MREKIGPVAAFKLAITVPRLPKTRSGKILRGTMKKIADGESWNMPATIEDPKVLDEIGGALKERGVGADACTASVRRARPPTREALCVPGARRFACTDVSVDPAPTLAAHEGRRAHRPRGSFDAALAA